MEEYIIKIVRKGECHRCGWCCQGCVHLKPPFEGVKPYFYHCEIYDKRNQFCEKCDVVHNCGDPNYPEFPIRMLNPYCGYRFYEEKSGVEVIYIVTPDWDWLSKHADK